MLSSNIRQDIYNIYGFVRFADEIVDTFHSYNKKELFSRFVDDLNYSLIEGISLNPILNSFQKTVNKYNIDKSLIDAFLKSMEQDLEKKKYKKETDVLKSKTEELEKEKRALKQELMKKAITAQYTGFADYTKKFAEGKVAAIPNAQAIIEANIQSIRLTGRPAFDFSSLLRTIDEAEKFNMTFGSGAYAIKTNIDLIFPPPILTRVLLPQPEARVMPIPKKIPPKICLKKTKFGFKCIPKFC